MPCLSWLTRHHARGVFVRAEQHDAPGLAALRLHALKHALPVIQDLRNFAMCAVSLQTPFCSP